MKRKLAIALVFTLCAALGFVVAGLATHTMVIEEHVVPFTIGDVTGNVTVTDTDALPHETITVTNTETVTITTPDPTEPPPDPTEPPPPGEVDCSISNYWDNDAPAWSWQDCRVGTTIVRNNALWFCDRPLSNYGALPIKVVQTWDIAAPAGTNGIELRTGCAGDGTGAIDLILDQRVEGVGRISDPLKTRMVPGPQNVHVTGSLNASGPNAVRDPADHQDCIQLQGGSGNYFVNMDACGDYNAGESNSQGAGGVMFWSINNSHAVVLGGEFIGCNHSLAAHPDEVAPASRVENAKFRSGNNTTRWCSQFNTSNPCIIDDSDLVLLNVICQRFVNGQWVDRPPS